MNAYATRRMQCVIKDAVCKILDETEAGNLIAMKVIELAVKGEEWAVKFANDCDLNVINRKLDIGNRQATNAENLIEQLKQMKITTHVPIPEHLTEYAEYQEA